MASSSELFVDICAGGFDVDADSSCELYSLFALSGDGDLYWRKGIRKNSPEGTEWKLIEPIPDDSGGIASSCRLCLLLDRMNGIN